MAETDQQASPSKLLVVDDSMVTRYRLSQFFTELGYTLFEAGDGLEAIAAFEAHQPDLILMDIHMPNMDGLTACKQIKMLEHSQSVPILMITTLDQEELIDQAFQYGALDYITKPIHWPVLRNRVEYLLRAKKAEAELFEEKEMAHATLRSIGDAVITTDAEGKVKDINPAAEKATGWLQEEAVGRALEEIYYVVDENTREPSSFRVKCSENNQFIANCNMLILRDGNEIAVQETATPIHDLDSNIVGSVLVFRDVTRQREQAKQISYQATHDALTGLINRREFETRCQKSLESAICGEEEHAMMYMDLDKFKIINDTCGHASGDTVLKEIANLMLNKTRARDHLARLGGDEFSILLENCKLFDAMKVAEKVRRAIQNYQFKWQQQTYSLGVSIGIKTISIKDNDMEKIMHSADEACYEAKNAGRNCIKVYENKN